MKRFIAAQLRKPSGWFGSLVMIPLLNRANRTLVEKTLAVLGIAPDHMVLEIGFGGGSAIELASKGMATGVICGVDFSADIVRQGQRRFRREIAEGRVRLQLGDVSQLEFPAASFDRVFTINTIYFWPDAMQGISEIRRVLKDGGRIAVSLRPKEKMQKFAVTQHNFQLYHPTDVAGLLTRAGFRDVRVHHEPSDKFYDDVVVEGTK